jgi:hypothetical protein
MTDGTRKNTDNFHMHWWRPFIFVKIRSSGVVRIVQLDGMLRLGWVKGACLKPYMS